jgi:hypothetical protein
MTACQETKVWRTASWAEGPEGIESVEDMSVRELDRVVGFRRGGEVESRGIHVLWSWMTSCDEVGSQFSNSCVKELMRIGLSGTVRLEMILAKSGEVKIDGR